MAEHRPREQRLQIMLTVEELEAIDAWRFAMRMPTRAAAIRELLRRGLGVREDTDHPITARSTDFGVIEHSDDAAYGPTACASSRTG